MPNKIEQLADGNLTVELETGEKFTGDALAVTQKMADAHVSTKRWGADYKQKYETLQSTPPATPATPVAAPNDQEAQLQKYLLDQTGKSLGYANGEEYKADLMRVKKTTEEVNNQLVATQFMSMAQDFPNSPEAIAALSAKIDERGWSFDPQSMLAAHSLLVREHAADPTKGYAPLTQEQINSSWEAGLRASNRPAAPPMISSQAPDANAQNNNAWTMDMKELRNQAIRQQLGK